MPEANSLKLSWQAAGTHLATYGVRRDLDASRDLLGQILSLCRPQRRRRLGAYPDPFEDP